MWRRMYLLLLLLRVYFALSPSYLHPDEVFQGPEVISGSVFPYPVHRTWEWTSDHPIRSVFPIWLFYGVPMSLLKSIWTKEDGLVEPSAIYYALRLVMFILSFVLEDWAIYELVQSPRRRKQAVLLVASSYVTWSFQTHTFSNSVETLLVLWCIVLIERIVRAEKRTSVASCFLLAFLIVLGTFNRITFPAFILIPGMRMLPHVFTRPMSLLVMAVSGTFWTVIAVATDTAYYTGSEATRSFRALFLAMKQAPTLTIINNIMYNTQTSNLAQHGLHPRYQHILINLPQLLGPALVLLVLSIPKCASSKVKAMLRNSRLTSAATGTVLLSIIPHQEPRFLLPCIPLLLTCVQLPTSATAQRVFWISWVIFNILLGVLMGVYHQGGIIPAQLTMPSTITQSLATIQSKADNIEAFWWKTYPPPTYLLGTNHLNPQTSNPLNISTIPLMGLKQPLLHQRLSEHLPPCPSDTLLARLSSTFTSTDDQSEIYLAAPFSAWRFDLYPNQAAKSQISPSTSNFTFEWKIPTNHTDQEDEEILETRLKLTHINSFGKHLNLDDMDFGDDGFVPTLERVVGRRGLGVWHVRRVCDAD